MTQAAERRTQAFPPEVPSRPLPDGPVTYEEFLDWCDEDTLAEWVDGKIELTSPANRPHQKLVGWLHVIFYLLVEQIGGEVLVAPFQMKLPEHLRRGREPDLLYVSAAHLDRFRNTYLDGPADLVVEVTSPESQSRDHGDKYLEYEAAGVSEYWLIDLPRRWFQVFRLGDDGRYRTVFEGESGEYRTDQLPGLTIRAEWLWQDPLPPIAVARPVAGRTEA